MFSHIRWKSKESSQVGVVHIFMGKKEFTVVIANLPETSSQVVFTLSTSFLRELCLLQEHNYIHLN